MRAHVTPSALAQRQARHLRSRDGFARAVSHGKGNVVDAWDSVCYHRGREMPVLALVYDGRLAVAPNHPAPERRTGEALVRVTLAGICNTDVEIMRGYAQYRGILGHEFVGIVQEACADGLAGKRVVGEINASCGECEECRSGRATHCIRRSVLGIHGRSGAFAEYLSLPSGNLHVVPETVSDKQAVFVEPLAAALQILEQLHVRPSDRVAVVGDGKLGLLVAQALRLVGCELVLIGKHAAKLALLQAMGVATLLAGDAASWRADIVVECTGNPSGLALARSLARPRGVIVLKSTYHGLASLDLSAYVVDEITLTGSRCGPFAAAIRLLQQGLIDVSGMITETFALADGVQAMARAGEAGVLKILLRP